MNFGNLLVLHTTKSDIRQRKFIEAITVNA